MEVKHTQGSDTTYLYPTNTREESHRSKVRKGVVYLSFFGKPILGFLLKFFWEKCPAGMT